MIPCNEIGTCSKTENHNLNELSHLKRVQENIVLKLNWQSEHIPNDWKSVNSSITLKKG